MQTTTGRGRCGPRWGALLVASRRPCIHSLELQNKRSVPHALLSTPLPQPQPARRHPPPRAEPRGLGLLHAKHTRQQPHPQVSGPLQASGPPMQQLGAGTAGCACRSGDCDASAACGQLPGCWCSHLAAPRGSQPLLLLASSARWSPVVPLPLPPWMQAVRARGQARHAPPAAAPHAREPKGAGRGGRYRALRRQASAVRGMLYNVGCEAIHRHAPWPLGHRRTPAPWPRVHPADWAPLRGGVVPPLRGLPHW